MCKMLFQTPGSLSSDFTKIWNQSLHKKNKKRKNTVISISFKSDHTRSWYTAYHLGRYIVAHSITAWRWGQTSVTLTQHPESPLLPEWVWQNNLVDIDLMLLAMIWHHLSQSVNRMSQIMSSISHFRDKENVSYFTKIECLRLHLSRAFVKAKTLLIHNI